MALDKVRNSEEMDEVVAAVRAPRRSREDTKRPEAWQPASVLPEPDKQPGYSYKWVRVSSLGKADPRNVSAKMRIKFGNKYFSIQSVINPQTDYKALDLMAREVI